MIFDPTWQNLTTGIGLILATGGAGLALRKRNSSDTARRAEDKAGTGVLWTVVKERDEKAKQVGALLAEIRQLLEQRVDDAERIAMMEQQIRNNQSDIRWLAEIVRQAYPELHLPSDFGTLNNDSKPRG